MLGIETDSRRIFGLDLLRALAIFFVVHGHGSFLLSGTCFAFLTGINLPHGVDIFFVLSGFLIGTSFLSYSEKNERINLKKVGTFYGRTVLRILPNYYVVLLIYCVLVQKGAVIGNMNAIPLWRFATFTQNMTTPFYDFYWESWSLPVQWWFYIMFPVLLFICGNRKCVRKATPLICLFFIITSWLYRYSVSSHVLDSFWWDVWLRKTVASRTDNIYIGVLAAWVRVYLPEQWNKHTLVCLLSGLALMVFTLVVPRPSDSFYSNVVFLSIPPVAISLWLPFLTTIRSSKTFIGKVMSHISVLSYAMFLINLMVAQLIAVNFAELFQSWGACGYVVYWVIVLIASYLLYMVVERPFDKLRARV